MIEVRVCVGTCCHLSGSYNVIQDFQQLIEEYSLHEIVTLEAIFCMKQCGAKGVAIKVDEEVYRVESNQVKEFFHDKIMSKIK
jgi:NADH:ubiquinone oxidoreductase subunit E